jgi:glycosyltransferase involved in cell wall biosynthesis
MPNNTLHKVASYASGKYGIRHILFYIYLLNEAKKWKDLDCIVRIFGVNLPIISLLKNISSKKIISSFQYDWAEQTKKNYGLLDIKKYSAKRIQYTSLKYSDIIISTMPWLKDKVKESFNNKEVVIVPNYVNTQIFKPIEKKKQIVFAGRLHWSKNVDTLINAFKLFCNDFKNYSLILLGDGEERDKLEILASDNKNIIFKGNVAFSDVAHYFNESEIFILPTKTMEGHPKALIEAMASGCKCIASNVAGNKDVLLQSDTSEYIFEPDNVKDLYNKIIFAISDKEIYKKQYKFATTNYDSKLLFRKEIEILIKIKDRKNV